MPLSEYERRVLDELEQDLIAADRASVGSGRQRWWRARSGRISSAGSTLGVLVGVGYVLLGVASASGVGVIGAVIGFVLIVVSCSRLIGANRNRRSVPPSRTRA